MATLIDIGYTASAWIKPDELQDSTVIFASDINDTGEESWEIRLVNDGGTLRAAMRIVNAGGGVALSQNSFASIPLNAWTHLAVTDMAGDCALFIDGVPDLNDFSYVYANKNLNHFGFGGFEDASGKSRFFSGLMDEVRVYSGPRPTRIADISIDRPGFALASTAETAATAASSASEEFILFTPNEIEGEGLFEFEASASPSALTGSESSVEFLLETSAIIAALTNLAAAEEFLFESTALGSALVPSEGSAEFVMEATAISAALAASDAAAEFVFDGSATLLGQDFVSSAGGQFVLELRNELQLIADLHTAFDAVMEENLDAPWRLSFKLPCDPDLQFGVESVTVGKEVWVRRVKGGIVLHGFTIYETDEVRGPDGGKVISVQCEDYLAQLAEEAVANIVTNGEAASALSAVVQILNQQENPNPIELRTTPVSLVQNGSEVTFQFDAGSALEALSRLREILGGHFYVDFSRRLQWFASGSYLGSYGHRLEPSFNIKSIRRRTSRKDLVTRLYAYGAGGENSQRVRLSQATGSSADYIEDIAAIAAYGTIKRIVQFPDIINPNDLMTAALNYLAAYKAPRVEYRIDSMDQFLADTGLFSAIGDAPGLGFVVRLEDPEFASVTRIVAQRTVRLDEPINVALILSADEPFIVNRYASPAGAIRRIVDQRSRSLLIDRSEVVLIPKTQTTVLKTARSWTAETFNEPGLIDPNEIYSEGLTAANAETFADQLAPYLPGGGGGGGSGTLDMDSIARGTQFGKELAEFSTANGVAKITPNTILERTWTGGEIAEETVAETNLTPEVQVKLNALAEPFTLEDESVETRHLADNAVGDERTVGNEVIQNRHLANETVTTEKIASLTIISGNIKTRGVYEDTIYPGITGDKIAPGAVLEDHVSAQLLAFLDLRYRLRSESTSGLFSIGPNAIANGDFANGGARWADGLFSEVSEGVAFNASNFSATLGIRELSEQFQYHFGIPLPPEGFGEHGDPGWSIMRQHVEVPDYTHGLFSVGGLSYSGNTAASSARKAAFVYSFDIDQIFTSGFGAIPYVGYDPFIDYSFRHGEGISLTLGTNYINHPGQFEGGNTTRQWHTQGRCAGLILSTYGDGLLEAPDGVNIARDCYPLYVLSHSRFSARIKNIRLHPLTINLDVLDSLL